MTPRIQSGFVMDAGAAAAADSRVGSLQRVDAHTLSSMAPATEFSLRATVLAVQTPSTEDWLADLAALLATDAPAAAARAAHEDWYERIVVAHGLVSAGVGSGC